MKKLLPLFALLLFTSCAQSTTPPTAVHNMDMHAPMAGETSSSFSEDTTGLLEAQPSQIVELQDGASYTMTADMVKQTIGNRTIKRLAYNGQIPGPLLKVPRDASITVNFTNNTDVDTTLHSHGLRLANAFDGVPDVTQPPIKPGEQFTYTLTFPDEGIYWYHPHIREDYTQELGLYGNFLVEGDASYWNPVNREQTLILDDISLTDEGITPFSKDYVKETLMGRFGNILLVNNEEKFHMNAKQGELIRFYITNTANTRTFNLSIPKARLKLVGGDVGRIEQETFVDSIILAPAERYIVEAYFPEKGIYSIEHRTPTQMYPLGTITVSESTTSNALAEFEKVRGNSIDYSVIRDQFDALLQKVPDKNIKLSLTMKNTMEGMNHGAMMNSGDMEDTMAGMDHSNMMHSMDTAMSEDIVPKGIEWENEMAMMNSMSTTDNVEWKVIDEATGKENMEINDWNFQKGDLVKIRIFNDPNSAHPMQHPIHFHGQRFVVLRRDGKVNNNLQWKDTTLVQSGETVDIALELSNPGIWMAHCHIAEHLHAGMMFGFTVK